MASVPLQLREECSETLLMGKTALLLTPGSGESGREKGWREVQESHRAWQWSC